MITLGAASLSFDGFDDRDFVRTFQLAPEIGFRTLELNSWYPRNFTPRGVAGIRARCEETGLAVASVHVTGIGGADHKDLTTNLTHKMRGIEIVRELGGSVFCTLGRPKGSPGCEMDAILTVLDHLVPFAEDAGVTIALENHAGHAIETLEDYAEIFDRFDSAALGMCIDTGHFHAAGVSLDDVVSRYSNRVVHIHVKDNEAFGRKNFVAFGDGTVDNVGLVRSMIDRGYDRNVIVELSPTSVDFSDQQRHRAALETAFALFSPLEVE